MFTARSEEHTNRELFWLQALLLVVVVAAHGSSFLNDWTYDDYYVIVRNADVQSLAGLLADSAKGRYLRDVSLFLDYAIWGTAPAGYHLQQLLLHWANALLLLRICLRFGCAVWPALLGTLLFVVHPLQVESIANISHRKEPLSLLFVLIMLLAYQRGIGSGGWKRIALLAVAVGSYLLALAANETAISAPLLLVLFEALRVPVGERLLLRHPRLLLAGGLLLTGAVATYLLSGFAISEQIFKVYSKNAFYASPTYWPLFLGCFQVMALYAGKILLPLNLAPEYVVAFSAQLWQPLALVGAAIAMTLLALAIRLRRRGPLLAFGLLAFGVLYLPIANFFPVAYMMADRYLYMPMAGASLALAGALSLPLRQRRLPLLLAVVVLLLFAALSIRQNTVWRSEHTLWRHAVAVNPQSSSVRSAAAKSYLRSGELDLARFHARQAINIDQQNAGAYLTLARAEERSGNLLPALQAYETFQAIGALEYPREAADVAAYIPYLRRRLEQGR